MEIHREETSYHTTAEIFTGRFTEGPSYGTWRSRGTADWLLMYTLAGHGRVGFGTGEIVTSAHEAVIIKPRTLHDYGTAHGATGWTLLWAHFQPRPEWRELLDWPEEAPGLMRLTIPNAETQLPLVAALEKANRYAHGPLRRRTMFAMNALEQTLLLCDTVNPRAESAKLDPRVHAAIEYLMSHIADKVLIADIASACGLSESRLAHLFQEQVGQSPQRFLESERLSRARQMLNVTDTPIQNIAADLGFESAFYFSRRFRQSTGISPRAYRATKR
jgi:AraC family transcriptional regulator of arabinose operon